MTGKSLLIAADLKDPVTATIRRLHVDGLAPEFVSTAAAALVRLGHQPEIDVVLICGSKLSAADLSILSSIKKDHPLVEVIFITDSDTVSTAVAAIRQGAFDYLTKPVEPGTLLAVISRATARKQQRSKKILEIRMQPYLSARQRERNIAEVLADNSSFFP